MRVRDSSLGISLVSLCGFLAIAFETYGASVEENIQAIKSVGKEGEKHAAAIAAVKELSQGSVDSLPVLLKSFEGANPLAVNWLRSAVDTIADRSLKKTGKLPAQALEAFVKDTDRSPEARRLAY